MAKGSYLSKQGEDVIRLVKERKKIDREQKELSKAKEYLKSKTTRGKIKSASKKIGKEVSKKFDKKLFKKPKLKIKGASAQKLITQMGQESSGKLVKEVEDKYSNAPQDNRSLFFRKNYEYEKRKSFGGFI